MTIAERIRLKREELSLSQDELAVRCGYADKTSISKIENAGNDITLKKIRRVAEALGVTPSYLMGWEEENGDLTLLGQVGTAYQKAQTIQNFSSYSADDIELAMRLYDLYTQAPPEIQAAVETLLKATKPDSENHRP